MANNNPNYLVYIKQAGGATIVAPMPDSFNFDSKSDYAAPYAQGLFGNDSMISKGLQAGGIRLTSQANTAQLWQGATETGLHIELEFHTETDPVADVHGPILELMKMVSASVDPTSGFLVSPGPRITLDQVGPTITNAVTTTVNTAKAGIAAAGAAVGIGNGPAKQGAINTPLDSQNGTGTVKPTPSASVQSLKKTVANQISISIGRYAFFDSVVINNVQQTYSHQIDALTGLPLHAKVAIDFMPLFLVVQSDLVDIFSAGQR